MKHEKNHSHLPSLFLFIFLSFTTAAHSASSAPQQQKAENANGKITPLDEKQLRENTLTRLKNTIKEQNPNAVGLEMLTGDNITIKQKTPIRVGNTELWMVKIEFQGLPTTGPDDAKNIDMTMTVDPTGTYQFADITHIEKASSMFGRARRALSKVEVPVNTGTLLWKGTGSTEAIFISDPFCPFCRKEYVFLKENKAKIGSVKILHLPMPELHPTAKITSAILVYAKDKLPAEKFVEAVDFAYTDLNAGQENNKAYIQAIGLEPTLPQYVYKVIEKDTRAQQAAENQPLPDTSKKTVLQEELLNQADFALPLEASPKGAEQPQDAPEATDTPTTQEESKTGLIAPSEANKPPLQNLSVAEKALHQSLHKRISPEFMTAAPHIAAAVLQAIANAWGISNGKVISEYHLQRLQDERTIFYILENRSLLARHPHALKLGWELFQNEISQGMHVWSADIPDLPKAFTGIDLIGSKLMKYMYSNWADMGCLVPRERLFIFRESQCAVTLITGYRKGEPQRLNAFVHGDFIELNPAAFKRMVTCRQGKNTCDEALQHTFFAAYNRNWAGSGDTTTSSGAPL